MRARASSQVLPSQRPASNKGKEDRSSRSLSSLPLIPYVSRPPLSCFVLKFERWRTNCGSNFWRATNVENPPQVRGGRRRSTHLRGSGLRARRRASQKKVWKGTSSFFVVESPFVYTCDRWMGLLLAAPSSFRSPKSPALSKSNYAQDWDWSLVNTYAHVFDLVCFFLLNSTNFKNK